MKTEYRIIPYQGCWYDKYLQFKSTETVTKRKISNFFRKTTEIKEVWRFVPEDDYPELFGYYLNQECCPTELYERDSEFLGCFKDYEGGLKNFALRHPDIEVYFAKLKEMRSKYLKRQEDIKNDKKIEYL